MSRKTALALAAASVMAFTAAGAAPAFAKKGHHGHHGHHHGHKHHKWHKHGHFFPVAHGGCYWKSFKVWDHTYGWVFKKSFFCG